MCIAPTAASGCSARPELWPVNYGDRILVLKYIYLLQPPQRWDVVVFKSPDDPADFNYTQNFIKRLVGLPGEQLMVLDGDIYVKSGNDPKWHIQTKPLSVQEALWRIVYDNDYYPQHSKRDGQYDWTQPWKQDAGTRAGTWAMIREPAEPSNSTTPARRRN